MLTKYYSQIITINLKKNSYEIRDRYGERIGSINCTDFMKWLWLKKWEENQFNDNLKKKCGEKDKTKILILKK